MKFLETSTQFKELQKKLKREKIKNSNKKETNF